MHRSRPRTPPRHRPGRRMSVLLALAAAGCAPPVLPIGLAEPACRRVEVVDSSAPAPAVHWRTTVAGRERLVLDAWCLGVAPGVVDPLPETETAIPVDSLVVVSWNAHAGGGDIARLVAELRGGELGAPPRHFVLLLQEVFRDDTRVTPPAGAPRPRPVRTLPRGRAREDIAETANRLGLSLLYVPSMWNGPDEDRGNAILSTLPLADLRVIELPFESQRRVAVAATVLAPAASGGRYPLRVVSVHLDTRSVGARLWAAFGAGRLRQAQALMQALPDDDLPTVLAGDLNTWSLVGLEGTLRYLRSRFPDTPAQRALPTLETGWGYRRTLDHMFLRLPERWTARVRRLDQRYGSDHYPLLGRIAFPAAR